MSSHIILISAMLLDSGSSLRLADGHSSIDDIDDAAVAIYDACGHGPTAAPSGSDCWAAMAAIWWTEAKHHRTTKTKYGCGPGQVLQPSKCFRNSRIGKVCAPPCVHMIDVFTGFKWAAIVLRWKAYTVKHSNDFARIATKSFMRYNGHPRYMRTYGHKTARLWRKIRGIVE